MADPVGPIKGTGGRPDLPPLRQESMAKVLRHRSLTAGQDGQAELIDNERLSFLGNSVLAACVTQYIFIRLPLAKVGTLSTVRSSLTMKDRVAAWCQAYGLENKIQAALPLAAARLQSAQIYIFQAYLGAIVIDYGWEVAQTFINALLDAEKDNGELAAILSGALDASGARPPSPEGSGTVFGTNSSDSGTMYNLASQVPLGSPGVFGSSKLDDLLKPSLNVQGVQQPQKPSVIYSVPTMQYGAQFNPQPPQQPSFTSYSHSQPQSQPQSPPPQPQPAILTKSYLGHFNEICAQRSQNPTWSFSATGPPHNREWEAHVKHPEGVQCKGTAKSKQDAKNRAAYQALLLLNWPLPT
ncbi:ribonuclease III [Clavulina sp. PMI_390]|nr:ribonuclease III [Clavulina sp. PMI_390]